MVAFVTKGVYDYQKIALLSIGNLYQYKKSIIYSSQIFTLEIANLLDIVIDTFLSKLE